MNWKKIISVFPEPVLITDNRMNLLFYNKEFGKMELDPDDILKKVFFDTPYAKRTKILNSLKENEEKEVLFPCVDWEGAFKETRILISMKDIGGKKILIFRFPKREGDHSVRYVKEEMMLLYYHLPMPTYVWKREKDRFFLYDYNLAADIYTGGRIKDIVGIDLDDYGKDNPDVVMNIRDCFFSKTRIEKKNSYVLRSTGEEKYLYVKYVYFPPDYVLVHTEDITKEKEYEKKLSASEERLNLAMEATSDGLWDWDLIQDRFYFNRQFLKMTDEDGKNGHKGYLFWKSLFSSEDFKNIKGLIEKAMIGKNPHFSGEYKLHLKNGKEKWILLRGQVIKKGKVSSPRRVIGTFTDIDYRVKIEKALRESEKRFRDMAAAAGEFLWEIDRESRFTYLTSKAGEIYDCPTDDLLGTSPKDTMPKEDNERVTRLLNDHANHGLPFRDVIHKAYTFKGRLIWLRVSGIPITGEKGETVGFRGTALDITQEKNALDELEANRKFLQNVIDHTSVLIFIKNREGRYILANKSFLSLIDKTLDEVLGKKDEDFFPLELSNQYHKNDMVVFNGLKSIKAEEKVKIGKEYFTYLTFKFPVMDAKGAVYGVCGMATDITERIAMEETLKKAKLEAEKANRAKNAFLSNISHEIRTPLNAIIGYANLLSSHVEGAQSEEYLKIIKHSSLHLNRLLDDILSITQSESGKMNVRLSLFSLYDLLWEIMDIFKQKALDKKINLNLHLPLGMPDRIYFDEVKLRQILINIVGNAVKFTDRGDVSLSADYKENEGKYDIQFIVKDTGKGISRDKTEDVFLPFTRLESNDYEGVGLGLSISKKLTEILGGMISLESKKGLGTRFVIRFNDLDVESFHENREVSAQTKENPLINVLFLAEETVFFPAFLKRCEALKIEVKAFSFQDFFSDPLLRRFDFIFIYLTGEKEWNLRKEPILKCKKKTGMDINALVLGPWLGENIGPSLNKTVIKSEYGILFELLKIIIKRKKELIEGLFWDNDFFMDLVRRDFLKNVDLKEQFEIRDHYDKIKKSRIIDKKLDFLKETYTILNGYEDLLFNFWIEGMIHLGEVFNIKKFDRMFNKLGLMVKPE